MTLLSKEDSRMKTRTSRRSSEAGFTLIEALIATAVLAVGLVAITNLMVVAVTSNSLGNRITVATYLASQKMEQLRSIPFTNASLNDSNTNSLDVSQANYNETVTMAQSGPFLTRWNIRTVAAYGTSLKYIAVRTESLNPAGRLTRAEFTSFRSCSLTGCLP